MISDIEGTTDFRYSGEGAVDGRARNLSVGGGGGGGGEGFAGTGKAVGVVGLEVRSGGGVEGVGTTVELEAARGV